MAIANIIAKGIGFSPGSVKFIPTHGFIASGEPPPVTEVAAGWPTRLVKLPDGRKLYLNERQIEELRIRLSRQKPSKRQAKRVRKERPQPQEIEIPQAEPIPLPAFYNFIPENLQADRIQAEIAQILASEEDTLTILLMVS